MEVRPVLANAGRPRVIYRGPLEENGVTLTEDVIADTLACDGKFWDWVHAQIRARRIPDDSDGTVVRLKLSLSFIGQDASFAVVDSATGGTSLITEEAWEFHKGANGGDINNPLYIIQQFTSMIIEQQQQIHVQMAKMLKDVLDTGQKAIVASAGESAKIIQAAVEPLKSSFALVEKAYQHESTRADKASDCVIRMLNDRDKEDSSLDEATKMVTLATSALALLEKGKKVVN